MARLLLVEDNEQNRDMLSRRLRRKGYEVIIAHDGGEGLVLAREQTPDLILMDMSLRVREGGEAPRQLKADPATQSIPILGLSAHAMTSDLQKALNAGCDDYDTKPVEFDRLLQKMEALLARGRDDAR